MTAQQFFEEAHGKEPFITKEEAIRLMEKYHEHQTQKPKHFDVNHGLLQPPIQNHKNISY